MKKNITKILIIFIFIIAILFANKTSANITVPIINTVFANPESINLGASSEITWTASNQTYCTVSSDVYFSGYKYTVMSATVTPTKTTTYTVKCYSYNDINYVTTPSEPKNVTVKVIIPPTTNPNSPTSTNSSLNLFVRTDPANDITYTSATLHGAGGYIDSPIPTLPISAYFRYSPAKISPIFCNDIYGTNMLSTKDSPLDEISSSVKIQSFSQKITGLTPDTRYYYCAIISNRDNIAYGGTSIVKYFNTDPLGTTIRSNNPTAITTDSATLNGYYSSVESVTTSFEWKESNSTTWNEVGVTKNDIGSSSNISKNISFNLTGLTPNTTYQFRTKGVTTKNTQSGTTYGSTLNFTTSVVDNNTGGSDEPTGTCVYGGTPGNCNNPPYIPPSTPSNPPSTNTCKYGGTYPFCKNAPSTGSCPIGWTLVLPITTPIKCTPPVDNGTCQYGGTYPDNCDSAPINNNPPSTPSTPNNNNPYNPSSTPNNNSYNPPSTPNNPIVVNNNTCPIGLIGTYPNCVDPGNNKIPKSTDGGLTGTWTSPAVLGVPAASGTWKSDVGTMGTGSVTWVTIKDGSGTWTSATGSGTWEDTGSVITGNSYWMYLFWFLIVVLVLFIIIRIFRNNHQ